MRIKLTEKELIDLISDILTKAEFKSNNGKVNFYKLEDESELGEQEDGTSGAGEGVGTAAMTKWETGIARGVANQIAVSIGMSGYAGLGRGKANPLW